MVVIEVDRVSVPPYDLAVRGLDAVPQWNGTALSGSERHTTRPLIRGRWGFACGGDQLYRRPAIPVYKGSRTVD